MDGDLRTADMAAYLSRLLNAPVTADQPIELRSVQRAALASWARRNDIELNTTLFNSRGLVSIRALLGRYEEDLAPPASAARLAPPSVASFRAGLGVDIEEVKSLPTTADYREHPFYQDHFSPAEIAYCIQQADTLASFCGLWAAKEAVLKTGLAERPPAGLKTIEIGRDERGRPLYPNAAISISHTARTAIAICLAASQTVGVMASAAAPVSRTGLAPVSDAAPDAPPPKRQFGAVILLATLCCAAALAGLLYFLRL